MIRSGVTSVEALEIACSGTWKANKLIYCSDHSLLFIESIFIYKRDQGNNHYILKPPYSFNHEPNKFTLTKGGVQLQFITNSSKMKKVMQLFQGRETPQ